MLPCNVIVQETDENQVEVANVDPVASFTVDNKQPAGIADDIKAKLKRVTASL